MCSSGEENVVKCSMRPGYIITVVTNVTALIVTEVTDFSQSKLTRLLLEVPTKQWSCGKFTILFSPTSQNS